MDKVRGGRSVSKYNFSIDEIENVRLMLDASGGSICSLSHPCEVRLEHNIYQQHSVNHVYLGQKIFHNTC